MKRFFATLLVMLACVWCTFGQAADESQQDANKVSRVMVHSDSEVESRAESAVKEIHMARETSAVETGEADSFSPSDRTIYCVVTLKAAKAGTQVKFSWWVVDAADTPAENIINVDYSSKPLENVAVGHMTLPRDWPIGRYKVQVYINGELDRTLFYSVK